MITETMTEDQVGQVWAGLTREQREQHRPAFEAWQLEAERRAKLEAATGGDRVVAEWAGLSAEDRHATRTQLDAHLAAERTRSLDRVDLSRGGVAPDVAELAAAHTCTRCGGRPDVRRSAGGAPYVFAVKHVPGCAHRAAA